MEIIRSLFNFFVTLFSNPYIDFLLLLCVSLKILYPRLRGYMGEFWVKRELKNLPKENYIVLNDIMIKGESGTCQIDHLVISQFGVFVIEMKNYYGLILGDEYGDKWIHCIGRSKRYFQNPIHQNYGHMKALENLLNLNDYCYIPIVCFSNQSKLKIKAHTNAIVQLDNLITLIKEYKRPVVIDDINSIKNTILESNIKNLHSKKEHVSNIKNRIRQENKSVDNMVCPRCGAKLVQRQGRYGKFIGCSNYPKCRFTK